MSSITSKALYEKTTLTEAEGETQIIITTYTLEYKNGSKRTENEQELVREAKNYFLNTTGHPPKEDKERL